MIKTYCLLTVALCTVFIVGVGAVSSAWAAEWLTGGSGIMQLQATIKGNVEFEDEGNGNESITCSVVFDGTVGPGGGDNVTEMLTPGGVLVDLTNPLLCTSKAVCEESATDIELAPEGLPWKSTVILNSLSRLEDLWFSAKFWFMCLILGIKAEDECSTKSEALGGSGFPVENETAGVAIIGSSSPKLNCTLGGEEKGVVTFRVGSLVTSPGVTLAVSE